MNLSLLNNLPQKDAQRKQLIELLRVTRQPLANILTVQKA